MNTTTINTAPTWRMMAKMYINKMSRAEKNSTEWNDAADNLTQIAEDYDSLIAAMNDKE